MKLLIYTAKNNLILESTAQREGWLHYSLWVFLLRFFRALCWVQIVDDNCGTQETALQEKCKNLEGPSRSCEGRVKSYVCRTCQPSFDNIQATLTTDIQDSSGYTGGAAQIPQANTINDMSLPNLTTNIHNSSSYAGGAAQIPKANALKKLWRTSQVLSLSLTTKVIWQYPSHIDQEHSGFAWLRWRRCPNSTGEHK